MDTNTLQNYIKNNLITINEESLGRRCGDGRDSQNIAEAVFGADLGYIFAAVATLHELQRNNVATTVDVNTIVRAVIDEVTKDTSGQIYVHSDNHADQTIVAGGCGFNKLARKNNKFGLNEDDLKIIDEELLKAKENGNLNQVVYTGDHAEQAVVIVHSDKYSVKANNLESHISVFVVQNSLIQKRFESIASILSPILNADTVALLNSLKKWWSIQTEETRLALAADKPIYNVTIDNQATITIA